MSVTIIAIVHHPLEVRADRSAVEVPVADHHPVCG
jgi:hypothetical protein